MEACNLSDSRRFLDVEVFGTSLVVTTALGFGTDDASPRPLGLVIVGGLVFSNSLRSM